MQYTKTTKLVDLLHYRLKITTLDGRNIVGELLAFDKFMNLVIADAEEFQITKKSKYKVKDARRSGALSTEDLVEEEKRVLGLIILRGSNVLGYSVESAPATMRKGNLGTVINAKNAMVTKASGVMKPISGKSSKVISSALKRPIQTGNQGEVPVRPFQPPPGFKRKTN